MAWADVVSDVVSWPQRISLESLVMSRVRGMPGGMTQSWAAPSPEPERTAVVVLALRRELLVAKEAVRGSGGELATELAAEGLARPSALPVVGELLLMRGALGTVPAATVLGVAGGWAGTSFLPPLVVLPGGDPGWRRLSQVEWPSPTVTEALSTGMAQPGGLPPGGPGSLTRLP